MTNEKHGLGYEYQLTAWKDGSEKRFAVASSKREASSLVSRWKKEGLFDCIDVCETQEETEALRSKTIHTYLFGRWEKDYVYVGEDDPFYIGA